MKKKNKPKSAEAPRTNTMDVDMRWLEKPAAESPGPPPLPPQEAEPQRNTIPVDESWLDDGGEVSATTDAPSLPTGASLLGQVRIPSPRIRNRWEPPSLPPPPEQAARAKRELPPPLPREEETESPPPSSRRASKRPAR